jgi:putative transposase
LQEAHERTVTRLLAYCIMPNHWHLVLWPKEDGELSEYMRWLTVTHTQRWHARHETSGTGPLYQGRFKSFPVQADGHFYSICRYVERNALRAGLVRRAELWRWCSLWQWANERTDVTLQRWPLPRPNQWIRLVNQVETEAELAAVRQAVRRGSPFGAESWQKRTAARLGLEATLRPRGRPRKG